MDPAGDVVGRVAGELERDPRVVEVLFCDRELDHAADLARGLARQEVGERLRARAGDDLAAVGLVRGVDLELAGRRERRVREELVDRLLDLGHGAARRKARLRCGGFLRSAAGREREHGCRGGGEPQQHV